MEALDDLAAAVGDNYLADACKGSDLSNVADSVGSFYLAVNGRRSLKLFLVNVVLISETAHKSAAGA